MEFPQKDTSSMSIYLPVLSVKDGSSFKTDTSKSASIDFSSEDDLSALEEVDLLSKVQKLSIDYKSDPELSDGVMDELVVALNVGTKKYGWSDQYVKEMAIV